MSPESFDLLWNYDMPLDTKIRSKIEQ